MATSNTLEIILKLKDLTQGSIQKANKNIDSMKSSADKVSGSVLNLKNALIGLGAGVGLGIAIKDFIQFDDVMHQAGAVSNATASEMASLTDIAMKMGSETRYSASESAEGLKMMGMAGFTAQQQITALPGVLQLAAAGSMELGQATDIATNMLTAYGMQANELGRVNDVMVKAFTSSNSTLVELGEGFKYVAPIAKGLGTGFENLVGTLASLHNAGIKGSMAGTTLRGVLDALYNPTNDEAKLLADLSDRIGGVGLQIKDTSGDFVGFTSLVGQLEKANIKAEEALSLFGLRAGPGMAALLSQGSGALAEFDEKLLNSGGTAERIATQMEAGLGGAFRSLVSAWDGLKIEFGKGFEGGLQTSVEWLRDKIRELSDYISELRESGGLAEWSAKIGSAFQSVISAISGIASGFISGLATMEPFITRGLELAPTFLSIAVAAKGVSIALGVVHGIMSSGFLLNFGKQLLTTTGYVNINTAAIGKYSTELTYLRTASLSAGSALQTLAGVGIAAFAGWQIGKLIGEFETATVTLGLFGKEGETLNETVQRLYMSFNSVIESFLKVVSLGLWDNHINSTQEMVANIDPLLDRLSKFAEFKLPDDYADAGVKGIQELSREVNGAVLYWETYLRKAEMVGDTAGIEKAKSAIEELQAAQEKLNNAISSEEIALQKAQNSHDNYVQLIKGLKDEQIKAAENAAQKEIEAAEKAYQSKEKYNGQEITSIEQLAATKQGIEQQLQSDIEKIRLDAASQLQATADDELRLATETATQKIQKIQEEIDAGIKAHDQGEAEIQKIYEQYEQEKRQISLTTAMEIANEEKRINKEKVNDYIENLKTETAQAKSEYETRIAEIGLLESQGAISHEEAIAQKQAVDKEYYEGRIAELKKMASMALETGQLEAHETLITQLKALESEYANYQVSEAQRVSDEKKALEDAELSLAQARLNEKNAMITAMENQGVFSAQQAAEQKKQAEIDFLEFKLSQTEAAFQSVAGKYAEDTAEYKNALAEKMNAESALQEARNQVVEVATGGSDELIAKNEEVAESEKQIADAAEESAARTSAGWSATAENFDGMIEKLATIRRESSVPVVIPVNFDEAENSLNQLDMAIQTAKDNIGAVIASSQNAIGTMSNVSAFVEQIGIYEEIKQQFADITEAARVMGLQVDVSNMTLSEAAADVASRVSGWQEFNESVSGITSEFDLLSQELSEFSPGMAEAIGSFDASKLSDFSKKINGVRDAFSSGTVADAKIMADSVIDSYSSIYDEATETLNALKDQWIEYHDKVTEINEQIADINQTTEEKIRDMQRDLMTEEEVWQDKRLEYEEIYSQAVKELNQGNVDYGVELLEKARDVASELATEVTDSSGNVLSTLEQNTATATEMMNQASQSATDALSDYAVDLNSQQAEIQNNINATASQMASLTSQINSMTPFYNVGFTGSGSETLPLFDKITSVVGKISGLSSLIGMQNPKMNADFSVVSEGISNIQSGLRETENVWSETAGNISSIVPGINIDTQAAIGGIENLAKSYQNLASAKQQAGEGTTTGALARLPFAVGGVVPGTGNKDTVPASLPAGTFVIKQASTNKIGKGLLNQITGSVKSAYQSAKKSLVNVMLTPGEYLVPPDVIRKTGSGFWDKVNKTGKIPGFADGVFVGNVPGFAKLNLGGLINNAVSNIPKFANGGSVPSIPSSSAPEFANMGTIRMEIGNKSAPVYGKIDVLKELEKTLKKYRLQTI